MQDSGLAEHAGLIELGIEAKPREIIRFINFLAFFCRLAENLKGSFEGENHDSGKPENWQELIETYFSPEFYIKWAIFVFAFRTEHRRTVARNDYFFMMQKAARGGAERGQPEQAPGGDAEMPLAKELRAVLAYGEPFAENTWLIRKYIYLADAVTMAITGKHGGMVPGAGKGLLEIPAIGAMVLLPRGPFLFGEEKETKNIEDDFEIDVYPVTNRQFCTYLNGQYNGNAEPKDNEKRLIIYLQRSRISFSTPDATGKDSFMVEKGYDDHPVTGVTWYGAVDFCDWRTITEGKGKHPFRLPTEFEWEKAARGDGGNSYPWGDEFDVSKCNTSESKQETTTEVKKYTDGRSPYGCFDMAGNVWEWTSSDYDKGGELKVLKGGSWLIDHVAARCAYRIRLYPRIRGLNAGFRCARTTK